MRSTLVQCRAVTVELRLHVARQDELLVTLQERLKLDSKNSSKSPNSGGPCSGSGAPRRASERKRKAQKGHEGCCCRAQLDASRVDNIFECKPVEVFDCGGAVQVLPDEPVHHRVFDVPPVKAWAEGRLLLSAGMKIESQAQLPALLNQRLLADEADTAS